MRTPSRIVVERVGVRIDPHAGKCYDMLCNEHLYRLFRPLTRGHGVFPVVVHGPTYDLSVRHLLVSMLESVSGGNVLDLRIATPYAPRPTYMATVETLNGRWVALPDEANEIKGDGS